MNYNVTEVQPRGEADRSILPEAIDPASQSESGEGTRQPRIFSGSSTQLFRTLSQEPGQHASREPQRLGFSTPAQNQTLWLKLSEQGKPAGDNYHVDLNPDQSEHFPIDLANRCSGKRPVVIRRNSGTVYFVSNKTHTTCNLKLFIIVKKSHFVAVRLDTIVHSCGASIYVCEGQTYKTLYRYRCIPSVLIYSSNNIMVLEGEVSFVSSARFYLYFTSLTHNGRESLNAFMTSLTTGYVVSPGFGGKSAYPKFMNARFDLVVPPDHIVMISFPRVEFNEAYICDCLCTDNKIFVHAVRGKKRHLVSCVWGPENTEPQLYNSSLALTLVTKSTVVWSFEGSGFRMEFSFHHTSAAPVMHGNRLLNCSRSDYETFKQHAHCNLARDCVGGEDEGGHCPFSSPHCNGSVALGAKCYQSFVKKKPLSWYEANQACRVHGGNLATLRSQRDKEAMRRIFDVGRWRSAGYVGLKKPVDKLPYMYRNMWQWSDGVMAYSAKISCTHFTDNVYEQPKGNSCAFSSPFSPDYLFNVICHDRKYQRYFCEFDAKEERKGSGEAARAELPDLTHKFTTLWSEFTMTQCPTGHVTYSFLSCEPFNNCGTQHHPFSCTTLYPSTTDFANHGQPDGRALGTGSRWRGQKTTQQGTSRGDDRPPAEKVPLTLLMFVCADRKSTVPYSLVCDYVSHCQDDSDETFCNHGGECPELTCDSGQCFSMTEKCDKVFDCKDRSDEKDCVTESSPYCLNPITAHATRLPPPSIVGFDGQGDFTQQPVQQPESCPETHFRCAGSESHCLPVYVRCNGMYDCWGREDEQACDLYMCPGFYRCRESFVCLHFEHVCDGWPQCPQSDDELYCGLTCPPGCLCQGMALACSVTFSPREYLQMRYLDASRSKMKPADLVYNTYLVWLSVAFCSIDRVPALTWPNVMHLDLRHNDLIVVNMDSFHNLPNLRTLSLSNNPLTSVVSHLKCIAYAALQNLDLSKTLLRRFDSDVLSCYRLVTKLNISHCPLDEITRRRFEATPYLTDIDLSGSPVSKFPRDVFKGLDRLAAIRAENYKLCCKATLPDTFNEKLCFAPPIEISSCDDLLKSYVFRGCIWVFAAFAVLGNCGSFLIKLISQGNNPQSGFNVFVINLTVADFLMGVYLLTVGVADEIYRGQYLWHELTWKRSAACAAAGLLSLLSSEMSAMFICLITLDRFVVLTFPFSDVRFRRRSAAVACALAWAAGFILANVPLFPWTPKWDFYGHTGICIPLPITRGSYPGQRYAFGVMIILNFIFFVFIAAGQAFIYWSVRMNTMVSDASRKSKDLVIARRLLSVAVSDFLCWFPIGLLGIISSNGVPVSSDIRTATAIFVLPLNSSLNPFLYTFNLVMEHQRKARETQLIKMLESRVLSQKTKGAAP